MLLWLQTHAFRKRPPDATAGLPPAAASDGAADSARQRHRQRIHREIRSIRMRSAHGFAVPPPDSTDDVARRPLAELSA